MMEEQEYLRVKARLGAEMAEFERMVTRGLDETPEDPAFRLMRSRLDAMYAELAEMEKESA